MTHLPAAVRRREAGFTLMELLVYVVMFALLMIALLTIFDTSNKLARSQTHVADMQQSLRIAHNEIVNQVRMAGRAPGWNMPATFALGSVNNVAANTTIDGSADTALTILEGTDVLTVRGVLSGSIYRSRQETTNITGNSGTVRIENVSPEGVPLPIEPLKRAKDEELDIPLVLVSTLGELAIVVLDHEATVILDDDSDGTDDAAEIAFDIAPGTTLDWIETEPFASAFARDGIVKNPIWLNDSPARPIAMVGMLEENRYYIRRNQQAASDALSVAEPMPKLSLARFYAGTNTPMSADTANLRLDIADDVFDLQIAFGRDDDADGLFEDTAANDDEWTFNVAGDAAPVPAFADDSFDVIRITTLARTHRRDPNYKAPAIARIEDHAYGETPGFGDVGFAGGDPNPTVTGQERIDRMFHRRELQTVVDLRNL